MLKENIEPNELEAEMKVKLTELATIRDQIETNAKLLEESNARLKKEQTSWKIRENDLEQFNQVRQMLDVYEHPELSYEFGSLARAMIDLKNLNYNPEDIISKYENMLSLTSANQPKIRGLVTTFRGCLAVLHR